MIEKKLEKISEWFVSFTKRPSSDGKYIALTLIVKDNWTTPKNTNSDIVLAEKQEDSNKKIVNIIGLEGIVSLENLLDESVKYVEFNIEKEMKTFLLEEKTRELEKLFESESYSTLKKLEFVLNDNTQTDNDDLTKKEESKRQYNKKNKQEETEK